MRWLKVIFIMFLLILLCETVNASPGGTEKGTNCHCCYTNCEKYGLKYGEYHCHENGKQYIPSRKKVCPGPGKNSYYPQETEKPTVASKEPVTQKEPIEEEEKDTDFGGLIIGAIGGSIGTVLVGKRRKS